jgi:restriction system protein
MTSSGDGVAIPPARTLTWPVVKALRELGGSGRIDEINAKVAELEGFTDEQQQYDGRGNGVEIEYRLRWARTLAKNPGLLENVSRGVWALTKDGQEIAESEVGRQRSCASAGRQALDRNGRRVGRVGRVRCVAG